MEFFDSGQFIGPSLGGETPSVESYAIVLAKLLFASAITESSC